MSSAVSPEPVASAPGAVTIHHGDSLDVVRAFPDASFTLVYLDPPFNTGRTRGRAIERAQREGEHPGESIEQGVEDPDAPVKNGFRGTGLIRGPEGAAPEDSDAPVKNGFRGTAVSREGMTAREDPDAPVKNGFRGTAYRRMRGALRTYDDRFDDYWAFLEPRLVEAWRLLAADGTLYLHLDYREAHYAKVLLDALFGRDRFLNELVWAYDYGAKSRRRWPTKHDTILVYVKDPDRYHFDSEAVDREPYMAPGLVSAEKAARGKLPTDVWWHTIVPTSGAEKTGYPTQKPEGILRRVVQASTRPGDRVLDFFAGSGTTGAVASVLGRDAVLVDDNPDAIRVMRDRIPHARVHS